METRKSWVPALLFMLVGCQSMPPTDIEVSPESSVLGVDVAILPWGGSVGRAFLRATGAMPILTGVVFLKEPVDGNLEEGAELVPASWINGSRAYLLNPEPGAYLVVAVFYAYNMPSTSTSTSLGGGVTVTATTQGQLGQSMMLPAGIVRQTRTTIGPGRVEFGGALQIEILPGESAPIAIHEGTVFEDESERRLAELLHPGVTTRSKWVPGASVMMANPKASSVSGGASDREKFLVDARSAFGGSPWAEILRSID